MKTCLKTERICPYCEAEELYRVDAGITSHGNQGYRKGCRCEVCEAWHERDLARLLRDYRLTADANRRGIATLARMRRN